MSLLTRRSFLIATAGGVVAACSGGSSSSGLPTTTGTVAASSTTTSSTLPTGPALRSDPFSLGVASGDPTAYSVILWTRLAPAPLEPAGAMAPEPVTIGWHIGADDAMSDIVASGEAITDPAHGHSAHVDVRGLDPARTYWYRFFVGDYESEIGRTRTTPAPGFMADRLVLGHVSCQRYEAAFWTAFEDLAEHDLDAVLHCGDYIYERHGRSGVRSLDLPEPLDLEGYRAVYGAYKGDPALQAAHLVAPWIVTWDDHEVENNYQGDVPEDGSDTPDRAAFLRRRADAYQAWWEHMPVRLPAPDGPVFAIHRGVDFGELLSLSVLDTRQFRTDQVCNPNDIGPRCPGAETDEFTVFGAAQEAWLFDRLSASSARFNVLQQQVVMQQWRFLPGDAAWNLDQWDGYPAARQRLLEWFRSTELSNPIVLTGDVHSSWAGSLALDFDDADSEVVGTEFVGTSVSSDAPELLETVAPIAVANGPHLQWAQVTRRGWVRHIVTPEE